MRSRRWVLLTLTLVFNAFVTYYYLAIRNPADLTVTLAVITVLWVMWMATLTVTLIAPPASRMDRVVAALAPGCVVLAATLYFIA
ncbi:hypothetical protein DO944_03840 [Microbacterium sp. SMR1]|nr:hypothetical protein DO944_03840 [Microbacterium sp. SMR1]